MKHNRRLVKYFDLLMHTSIRVAGVTTQVKAPSLLRVLTEVKKVNDVGPKASLSSIGDTQLFTLEDIELDDGGQWAALLINRSDRLAADQAITDPKVGHFFVAKKADGQGNGYSSHVVIKLKPRDGRYLMLQETATGISSAHVARLLRRAVIAVNRVVPPPLAYSRPSNTGKPLKGRFRFETMGHPSDSFKEELRKGTLSNVELVTHAKKGHLFDELNLTEYRYSSIRLKPRQDHIQDAWAAVEAVRLKAKTKKMEEVRVAFKTADSLNRSVKISSDTGQLIDEERFVKKELIDGFGGRLDTASESIRHDIRDKMLYLLRKA